MNDGRWSPGRVGCELMLALAACMAACGAPSNKSQLDPTSAFAPAPDPNSGPPEEIVKAHRPWTPEFEKKCVLIATDVRIEGPVGLLDHVVTRSDPGFHERSEKTIPAGFLQQIALKDGVGEQEIKAWLDRLEIVATRRLTVLERPGPVDVVVLAAGDALWVDAESKEEKRGESLRFVGKIER